MPLRKMVIWEGMLFLFLLGNSLGLFDIVHVEAAPLIAPATQTPTPRTTVSDRRSTPSVTPSPTFREGEFINYKVQAGDNIFLIAQRIYGDSSKYTLILSANNITENARLSVGMILRIPIIPTPTATFTFLPSATATVAQSFLMPTAIPSAHSELTPTFNYKGVPTGEQIAIMNMLTTFATSTLVGSTLVCLLLAFVVYTQSRRIARQKSMARRIRPPLVH